MKAAGDSVSLYKSHANSMKYISSGEANRFSVMQFPHFVKNDGLSVPLKQHVTCPYSETINSGHDFSPPSLISLFQINPAILDLLNHLFPSGFPTKTH
jgi:hypothetical protein